MNVESEVTKRADERVNHYMGIAARVAFAVVSVGCVLVAGWFVFEGVSLGAAHWLRNALLTAAPPVLGMAVFTLLQLRWRAFARR